MSSAAAEPLPGAGIEACFRLAWPGFALDAALQLPGRGVSALFGHSGSGKTTLLRCLAGLERATDGYLAVRGEVWQDDARAVFVPTHRRPLGYVFQEASLFPHLSVRRNLEFGLRRVAAAERRVSLDHAIALLGIEPLLERMPERLSGGERQRVAIARALATSPRLLLMDEPLAALDAQRKAEILPYLERLHGELDIPVVYVSHAPEEVARLADHVVLLRDGRVLASGAIDEVMPRLDLPFAHDEEAFVVVDAQVAGRDERFALTRLEFGGLPLWITGLEAPLGAQVRARVLARDVSLALAERHDSSILNVLPARVVSLDDASPGRTLVRLDVAGRALLARITTRSAVQMGIAPGMSLFAQVKGVALLR
ncbi:molybdenum ABC transporter ATP-binding protein [Aromatoleum toluolicum]|uniref:Molybdenum ABC transporter ATP-binding protein n=1 Tax=Aromatoleum toluolicum TaxID=90060 RepID=A0ABX1NHN2_9RHOO|nr:molybdenum ABC transporter ATP-binding protein [Aromatoleum toluolicum]NMF98663.1 molybdenum ABC transporter ATP-binding protein [Aromatoleum toluolicum]